MKVGINSYAFRWAIGYGMMDIHRFLQKCEELDVDVVQICDNLPFADLDEKTCQAIRERYSGRFVLKTGYKGLEKGDIERALCVSHKLGASSMRLVIDGLGHKASVDEVVEVIKGLLPLLDKLDMRLSIENHFEHTPEELRSIVEKVGSSYITICYDCFNSIALNIDTEHSFNTLLPYIEDVHVKDVQICRFNTGFLFRGCRMGEGILDVEDIVRRTLALHGEAAFILEGWIDELSSQERTLKQEEEINKDAIRYLKELDHE